MADGRPDLGEGGRGSVLRLTKFVFMAQADILLCVDGQWRLDAWR